MTKGKLSVLLVGMLVSIGLAGSASALNITPSSVELDGWLANADVTLALSDSPDNPGAHRLQMQLFVNHGKVAKLKVNIPDRDVVDKGKIDTPDGINVAKIRVRHDGSVNIYFKKNWFHRHVHAGEKSDPFYIDYAGLAPDDIVTISGYRHYIFGSFGSATATIVPEPSTTALVGLGLAGLAAAGRKRQ